jgi:hypothetical protein
MTGAGRATKVAHPNELRAGKTRITIVLDEGMEGAARR